MARDTNALVLQMTADIRGLQKALDQGQRKFDKTADAIERRQRTLDKNLANLGREAGNFARPVQIGASLALGALTALSYQAARRAEAVNGAFEQTFRDMPKQAAEATAGISAEFGRLETDIKDNFTQLRSVLTALGVDAQQSLTIVDQLQRRSLDIAAFRDVSDADAFRAVISGITGETEPLKRFGIIVNETATKAELLRLGFKGNAQQASEAAKSIARANIIMRQSAEMHGQVARESDTLAEQEKRTRAEFTKAAEDFGKTFLPVAAKVLKWASDALEAFNNLPSGVQNAGLALLAFVAVSGPIGAAITGLRALIGAAIAARAAIMAIPAAGAAGGVGGGLLAGGTAGVLARTAPLAATAIGVGIGVSSITAAPPPANAPLEQQVAWARKYQPGTRRRRQLEAALAAERRAAPPAAAPPSDLSAVNQLAALGDFGLSAAQRAPTAAAGGGSRNRAAAVDRTPELREQLALELAIAQARATGDLAGVKAAEERQELARLTQQYEAAGYDDANTAALEHLNLINQAEVRAENLAGWVAKSDAFWEAMGENAQKAADAAQLLSDRTLDRLGYEAQLARISGSEGALRDAERRLFIEERTLEILRLKLAATDAEARALAGAEFDELDAATEGREMASSIVDVLRSDNIWEEAGRRFKDAAWNGLEDFLTQIFKGLNSSGGGDGGNWIATLASMFTGGRKAASGRQVTAGYPVLTGERRPEIFVPSVNGSIIPNINAAMSKMQSRPMAAQPLQPIIFDLSGAVLTTDLVAQMNQIGAKAQMGAVRQSTDIVRRSSAGMQQRQRRLGTT